MSAAHDPKSARLRLAMRPVGNFLLVAALFAAAAILASMFWWWWIADLAVGVLLYFLLFHVLAGRAIWLSCAKCGKAVSSNTAWTCGVCGGLNTDTFAFPFLNKCSVDGCGAEPKAYKCHHCGEPIFLTADEDATNCARAANAPASPPSDHDRLRYLRALSKEDKAAQVELAELDLKLKQIKAQAEGPKTKSPAEQRQEAFEREFIAIMGIHEYARRKAQEAAVLYKDDPEALKQALEAIEEIRRRHV